MSDLPERVASVLLGCYRLERELGAGGMATVYLAQDLKHDRPVALKVLRPELAASLGADLQGGTPGARATSTMSDID